ncbi:MAG: sigma 54-interacting transcriptional regulator [Clostridium argentinense]|uniref:Sigma 54-interacting transcriptional regulator n=1 Tax=Clostridium faecium TaxID=2762223 RepID=A0ABR8YN72_9CLOT|nr:MULTISPECIES: sigma-54 dependent transcriptional regulator PrdR [Clostridium]MBD8045665.1 sigma 54-interacting transcriptional regulator [Clostridium faecium]MBS5824820.1 sigma 54-interacting transcriptional regulator [Clostridium argentinense]MDU1350877.1 sigma-54 dependent transcriptional regulator PrdR [Clostridium argentinense]
MNIGNLIYKVQDIMNVDYRQVLYSDTVKDVLEIMVSHNLDEVIIVNKENMLMGIFTRKDLTKINTEKKEILEDEIINYAVKDVITIDPDRLARDARDIMISNNIGRLPVMEKNKVVGILTNNNLRDSFYLKIDEIFELQSNILDNIHEAVCICDTNGRVIYWNKSSEKLYNVKAEDIVGLKVTEHFNNPLIPKVLREGKAIENIRHEPITGKSVILSVIPIYNHKKQMIAVVSTDRDITEVVALSKKLESANAKVEMLSNAYNKEIANNYSFPYIRGKSKKIIESINLCQKIAPSSASVLITGESGTGKEVFAKAIHEASGREGQFVAINCSAIPENLLESELFGYVEGAFTGATKKGKMGMFEFANNGTLFLDEIGDMPIGMQSKLLRVLQDGLIYKLGSEKPIHTDARIIAATNKDLKKSIEEGTFRNDLFYRLAIVQVELPPLRERREDIKDLINLFINQLSEKEKIEIKKIDSRIYDILSSYKWYGNIRELKNVIQRMVLLSSDKCISIDNIPKYILNYKEENFQEESISLEDKYNLEKMVKSLEYKIIKEVMNITNGNKAKAAEIMQIKRSTLYYKLKQYNMLDTCQ